MKRVITAAVLIPLVTAITLFAPHWFFTLVVGLVAALAAHEFFALGDASGAGCPGKWFLLPAGLLAVSFYGGAGLVLTTLVVSAMALLLATVFDPAIDRAFGRVVVGLSGIVYCSLTLGFLIFMPSELILTLFAIIWAGDTAAYYAGRAFGRHLLAPRVSPKKTVEGGIAGLGGSIAAGAILAIWYLGVPWPAMIAVSGATAIAGQLGDLAESALKRSAGVKDSSSILPGHGGILDRLDSLFFASPVFYWLFYSFFEI